MWLGTMDCAGYEWTVVAESEQAARAALTQEYRERAKRGDVTMFGPRVKTAQLEEYFGMNVTELALGKVAWL